MGESKQSAVLKLRLDTRSKRLLHSLIKRMLVVPLLSQHR